MPSKNPILSRDDVLALTKLEEVACELLSVKVPDDDGGLLTSVLVVRENVLFTARWTSVGNVEVEVASK